MCPTDAIDVVIERGGQVDLVPMRWGSSRHGAGTTDTEVLKPAPDGYLQVWPVSRRVNSSRAPSDDQSLIVQIAA
jgi:putative SOS response-associated peptidase YedK